MTQQFFSFGFAHKPIVLGVMESEDIAVRIAIGKHFVIILHDGTNLLANDCGKEAGAAGHLAQHAELVNILGIVQLVRDADDPKAVLQRRPKEHIYLEGLTVGRVVAENDVLLHVHFCIQDLKCQSRSIHSVILLIDLFFWGIKFHNIIITYFT